jgi:iron(III) transport system substrate-binding protein
MDITMTRAHLRVLRRIVIVLIPLAALALLGCRGQGPEVVVYTSVDQVFSEPILRTFERDTGIVVRAVFDTEETKSTGVLNRLVAEAPHPQADVFWSGDPIRPFVLIKQGLVESYLAPPASSLPPAFRAADGSWTGFAARARILLVNRNRLPEAAMPRSVSDLADPRWRNQTAIANPLFGTTTIHIAALSTVWGEDKTRRCLDALTRNGVRVASSNGEVKRLVVAGEVAFGLVDTDDGNEALKAGAPVEVVYPDQDGIGTLVLPTSAVLLRGGPNPVAGRRLIDFLVSAEVERRMAESAAHIPLRQGVPIPSGVRRLDQIRAMHVDYSHVAAEMQRVQPWLRKWVGL